MGVRKLLIGLAILVVVAASAVVALRKPLLKEGVEWWLADLGIPLGALTVAHLDHRSLVLRDLSVGPGNVLSVGSVEVEFALPDLFSGQMQAVRVNELRIAVDLARDPAQLEKVVAHYHRISAHLATGTDAAGSAIPRVFVDDGRFSFLGAVGSMDIAFAALVLPDAAGRPNVAADLIAGNIVTPTAVLDEIKGPVSVAVAPNDAILVSSDLSIAAVTTSGEALEPFALRAQVEADFDASGDALDLALALKSPDAGVDIRTETRLSNVLTQPMGSLVLSGTIDAAGKAWNAVDTLAGGTGKVIGDFAGTLAVTPLAAEAPSPSEMPPLVQISGTGQLALDALVIPDLGRAATQSVGFNLTATQTSLDVQISPGSVVSVVPADKVRAGLPAAAADLLEGEISVDLSQSALAAVRMPPGDDATRWSAELRPHLDLRAEDGARLTMRSKVVLEGARIPGLQSVEGDMDLALANLSVAMPALRASDIRADLALGFSANKSSFDVRLARPGTVSVGALSAKNLLTQAPVRLALTAGTLKASGREATMQQYLAFLDIRTDDAIRAVVRLPGAEDRPLEASLGSVRLTGSGIAGDCSNGAVAIDETTLETAGDAIELRDVQFTLSDDCQGGGLLASASIGAARHVGDQPLVAPVSVRAHLTDTDSGYAFDGTVALTDGTELFVVAGGAEADGSSGEITVARTAPLEFTTDGPAPGDLSQTLRDLKRVRGQVDGTARYRWSADGTSSTARLDVRGLSFDLGAAAVRDVEFDLALQPAWPPVTPTSQVLSIGRIDVGAALEDVEVDYDLLQTEPTQLRINNLTGRFLGGTVRLAPFTVDPTRMRTETALHITGLDMAALATLTKLEALNATGRLGGKIPVVMEDGNLAIRGGRLDADGPGRLSFRSAKAAELLRGQGTEVDLMLQALQDFRYESLGMDLDKTAGDDLSLKLSLLGSNPDVLDGHPFRVNLNLISQITPLLDALATLYQVSRETLERVWTTQ